MGEIEEMMLQARWHMAQDLVADGVEEDEAWRRVRALDWANWIPGAGYGFFARGEALPGTGPFWQPARGTEQERYRARRINRGYNDDYSASNPSEVDEIPWIYALSSDPDKHTERCGKWMLFRPTSRIDEVWRTMKRATEEDRLGPASKCATNTGEGRDGKKAICIYTYDGDDKEDVRRVFWSLQDLGFKHTIYWKADSATLAGQYSWNTPGRVSRYSSKDEYFRKP